MARRRLGDQKTRRLSHHESVSRIRLELKGLADLCRLFDQGQTSAFTFSAAAIYKVLCDENASISERRKVQFSTIEPAISEKNLLPENKLVTPHVTSEGVTFFPIFQVATEIPTELSMSTRNLGFQDWWNKDLIILGPSNQKPRLKFTRRKLIKLIRDKYGAHLDRDVSVELEVLERQAIGAVLTLETPEGILSTKDGSLPIRNSALLATLRQVSQEVLQAYAGHEFNGPKRSMAS